MYKLKYDFFIGKKKILSKNKVYEGKVVIINNGIHAIHAIQIKGRLFCKNEVEEI